MRQGLFSKKSSKPSVQTCMLLIILSFISNKLLLNGANVKGLSSLSRLLHGLNSLLGCNQSSCCFSQPVIELLDLLVFPIQFFPQQFNDCITDRIIDTILMCFIDTVHFSKSLVLCGFLLHHHSTSHRFADVLH